MTNESVTDFPPIEAAYKDEFGEVDPEVYQTAKEIWSPAKSFALRLFHDSHRGLDLLLKAVVKVSRARKTVEINNLKGYLFLTYKRLVLAELEKENGHRRILAEHYDTDGFNTKPEDDLNKKILINELRRRMDDWMREVFDFLSLGYNYEDLVPRYGKAANIIRSKYSKKTAKLARRINDDIKDFDTDNIY